MHQVAAAQSSSELRANLRARKRKRREQRGSEKLASAHISAAAFPQQDDATVSPIVSNNVRCLHHSAILFSFLLRPHSFYRTPINLATITRFLRPDRYAQLMKTVLEPL